MTTIVCEGMLPGKGESIWADTTCPEDFTVVVEPLQCVVERIEGVFCENVLACDITEIEECIEGLDDIRRYVTFECMDENLATVNIRGSTVAATLHLHQRLRIIAGPLLEVPSLFKSSEAGKEGSQCDAVMG